jgi:hypothetical protein
VTLKLPLLTPHQRRFYVVAADKGSIAATLELPPMRRAKIKIKRSLKAMIKLPLMTPYHRQPYVVATDEGSIVATFVSPLLTLEKKKKKKKKKKKRRR